MGRYCAVTKETGGYCGLSIPTKLILKFSSYRDVFRGGSESTGKVVDLSSGPQHSCEKLGVVLDSYTPSTGEAETGRSLGLAGQPV